MTEKEKENAATCTGVGPVPMQAGGGGAPFVIPPLTKSSTGLQRRQDLAERDQRLDEKLSEISLQSNDNNSAKTPGKKGSNNDAAPKTPGAMGTPGKSRPAPVATPSPGLRRIRERLGDGEPNSSSTFGGTAKSALSKEDLLAREQASRAMAEAEKSAAAAIDAIFAQQEGTLLAMSAALKAESTSGSSILLEKIAKAVEETTREQLAALSGVSKEGDDILLTAVYWITLARFESNHGRDEAARKYLTDGIAWMEAKREEQSAAVTAGNNTTQINALRLALDRMDKKQTKENEKGEQEEEQTAEVAKCKPKPRLPPSSKVKSPGRRRKEEEAPVTPTRRSSRIKAKSAEKEKK